MRKKTLKGLTKELDKIFSEYIRRKYANENGLVKCVSCPKRANWKELQCGHYVKRSARSTRWSVKNCFPQCVGCNVFQKGNYPAFTSFLLTNYGAEYIQDLVKEGQKIRKWTIPDLEKEIERFKELISKL